MTSYCEFREKKWRDTKHAVRERPQRVNGKFYAVYWDDAGCRHRRSLGTDDCDLAKTRLGEFKRQISRVQALNTVFTVRKIFELYIEDRAAEHKPAVQRIKDAWKRLGPVFGDLLPSAITRESSREYIKGRREDGASDGTIHLELGYLKSTLRYGLRERLTGEVPNIALPRKPEPRDHFLTKEQAQRLIDAASQPHLSLFITLALSTAARTSALLDLTWDRVDLERRKIVLRDPQKPLTPKGRATVPINNTALTALFGARKGAQSPYVIEWGAQKVASVKKGIRSAAAKANVKASPHVLRHTAAVWMAEGAVPMEEIAQYMGHDNLETTRRVYARYSPDYLRKASGALEL